jgi:hypothetical protein
MIATTRIMTPNEKCRLISVVTGVLRPICGMVHATMNWTTTRAAMSQWRNFAVAV